jgi:hypothetical protein
MDEKRGIVIDNAIRIANKTELFLGEKVGVLGKHTDPHAYLNPSKHAPENAVPLALRYVRSRSTNDLIRSVHSNHGGGLTGANCQ